MALRQLIEGPFVRGDRVAIVEDVITTGASALRAASAVLIKWRRLLPAS